VARFRSESVEIIGSAVEQQAQGVGTPPIKHQGLYTNDGVVCIWAGT
jgi:hypothetical protein